MDKCDGKYACDIIAWCFCQEPVKMELILSAPNRVTTHTGSLQGIVDQGPCGPGSHGPPCTAAGGAVAAQKVALGLFLMQ